MKIEKNINIELGNFVYDPITDIILINPNEKTSDKEILSLVEKVENIKELKKKVSEQNESLIKITCKKEKETLRLLIARNVERIKEFESQL